MKAADGHATVRQVRVDLRQQLDLLVARGMAVPDRAHAIEVLQRTNYYRLSGYWYVFKHAATNTFPANPSFETVVELYEFDRRLRLLMLDAIERFEVHLRTQVAYVLAHRHGSFAHESPRVFEAIFRHVDWCVRVHESAHDANEDFVDHYKATYDGFPKLPVWMAVEQMSFGVLCRMVRNLLPDLRREIAADFGVNPDVFSSWTLALVYVRNMCAHHSRVWNRILRVAPKRPRKGPLSEVPKAPNEKRAYFVLLMLRELTKDHRAGDDWARDAIALMSEFDAHPWRRNSLGMPADWRTHGFWKT